MLLWLFVGLSRMEGYKSANRAVFILAEDGTIMSSWIGEHLVMVPVHGLILRHI